MSELSRQVLLAIMTVAAAAIVLVPLFVVLKLLPDAGLEVIFGGVVVFGLLLAHLLRRQTSRLLKTGECRGVKPLCRGSGGVPQIQFSSPGEGRQGGTHRFSAPC